jgi:hypothetical protein
MQMEFALKGFASGRGFFLAIALISGIGTAAEPAGAQRIFRCEVKGQTTFADRPCPEAPSTEVQLSPVNAYHAEAATGPVSRQAAKASPGRERASKSSGSIANEQQKEQQRCQRLADQLATIRSKMRSGYTADQGEKLRERQRQLEQQRRTERCR